MEHRGYFNNPNVPLTQYQQCFYKGRDYPCIIIIHSQLHMHKINKYVLKGRLLILVQQNQVRKKHTKQNSKTRNQNF